MFKFHRLSAGASAFALLVVPTLARGEENQDRSDIVVTAQFATDEARKNVEKRPGGVDVVDASAFANNVAISLRDALAFSPGVYTQPRFGQEIRLSVRGSGISRGFHMRGLTLLQDGIPINLADDNGDFQELDLQIFERIEVYRGGNALRFGGSTLGGAINAVTPTGRTAPHLEFRVDGGSFNSIRSKAAAGFATESEDAYLALTIDNSDGDRGHARRASVRFNGNLGVQLAGTVHTRFYATISRIDQDLPGSLTMSGALKTPGASLPSNIIGDQERNVDSVRLQNRTNVDLGHGQFAFGLFYNVKQLFHPIFQVIDQQSDDYGVFASIDLAGGADSLPWELTLGTQARFGKVDAKQFVNVAGARGALTARTENTARTVNTYGELRITPIANLTIVGGGIYTSGKRKIDNLLIRSRSGQAQFDVFAPKIGLLYEPFGGVQIYANYNRSVELPGYSELSQTPATGLPGFAAVRPQKAWTFEIGTRGRLGLASWDVSIYRADLNGEMLQYTVAPDFPASTFNAGRTRHQGIEAGLDLALAPWGRLRQAFQLNDFRFRRDIQYGDNRLPVVPKHQYRAELRLGADEVSIAPNLEWVPDGAWADYRNTVRARGYILFGLGAEAHLKSGITFFADVRNLTGKKAVGDISAVLLSSPASVAFYPVERRAFYGGLRTTF